MPTKHLKGKARLQKQADAHRRQLEQLKSEVAALHKRLVASIDNAIPISSWLPRISVRLRKTLAHLTKQNPCSKKEIEQQRIKK
jgi:hypothetical protein